VLSLSPGSFQNVLICGISTRLNQLVNDWDEVVRATDADFAAWGLHRDMRSPDSPDSDNVVARVR
jgi:hypothetical protein